MSEYALEPHDAFIDVTPILSDPFGTPIRLGTVRYRVSREQVALHETGYAVTNYVALPGYPNSALGSMIQFEVRTSWADRPQPTELPNPTETT